jgi:hypothetical protein
VVVEGVSSLAGDLATSAVIQEGDAGVLIAEEAPEVIRTTEAGAHREEVQSRPMEHGSNRTLLYRRTHSMRPTCPVAPMRTRPS